MFLIIYLIFLVCSVLAETESPITTPTFIWGTKLLQTPNVLQVVSSIQFAKMLGPLQREHMIIAYFSPTLSVKDFSCLNEDCYPFLHEVGPSKFFSRVQQPLNALQRISLVNGQPVNWKSMKEMLTLPCESRIYAYNFSNLQTNEHEDFMSAVAMQLSACPVIYVYTAYASPMQEMRKPRSNGSNLQETTHNPKQPTKKIQKTTSVLRHAQGIVTLHRIVFAQQEHHGQNIFYKGRQIDIDAANSKLLIEQISMHGIKGFKITIVTNMEQMLISVWPILGNWRIKSIQFSGKNYRPRDLVFYGRKFSFCCNVLSVYSDQGGRLNLYSFHMDLCLSKNISAMDPDYKPKRCWYCEEYLTPGINQLIFTMLIMIILLSGGIYITLTMGRSQRFPKPNEPDIDTKTGNIHD